MKVIYFFFFKFKFYVWFTIEFMVDCDIEKEWKIILMELNIQMSLTYS